MDELKSLLKKLGIPLNCKGTTGIEEIEKDKVSYIAEGKYFEHVKGAGAYILTNKELYDRLKAVLGNIYIVVDDPRSVFAKIHDLFYKDLNKFNLKTDFIIHDGAIIGENVKIGKNTVIYPNSVIGSNVSIGEDCIIYPGVYLYDDVIIGNGCVVDSGAVIGSDGFNVVKDGNNILLKHLKKVIIGNNVRIGACCCVDRGLFVDTLIKDYVKLDNHVHIGHNAIIGENTVICSFTCVGGSSKIGKDCWIGIGCMIKDHIKIGDVCRLQINSVVVKSVAPGSVVAGFYAMDNNSWLMKVKDDLRKYVADQS